MAATPPRLALTAGEPAGIGPDICLMLAAGPLPAETVLVGDRRQLAERAAALGIEVVLTEYHRGDPRRGGHTAGEIPVMSFPLPSVDCCGTPDPANAGALLAGLEWAARACLEGEFDALVTAPVQKSVINEAGHAFSGHTEFLAAATGAPLPVMMLATHELRIALATTHLPLADVPAAITAERLTRVIDVLHHDLRRRFGIAEPRIRVCGLNPHAGEGGHLGREELDVIAPALDELRARGMALEGPVSADTAFLDTAGKADAVLAMYHDQGLPVIKYAGFGKAVNITLGLPIVRTSVDHGTALSLAGTGRADSASLGVALRYAAELAARRE
ncbi:MAG: 4-hydroxythreonine-4-phosphate dehydrogenase PdxA [Gammaproteobacteria bacterium]|nr:4-hydroxythreonine-4-phosphate dehydrogenase PdxA [Gammaproteobacteria bacterium]